MPREAPLPPIWSHLRVNYVQRVSEKEYSASCPRCGGEVHQDGEWPDRLRIFVDDKPLIWCRRCSLLQFPDQTDSPPVNRAELDAWRQKQIEREESRKRSAERALQLLRDSERWRRYHRCRQTSG